MSDEERRIGLPPDLFIDHSFVFPFSEELPSTAWHITPAMKELHRRGIDGRDVTVAVNDTGESDHPFLPKRKASKDFTSSRYGTKDTHGNAKK